MTSKEYIDMMSRQLGCGVLNARRQLHRKMLHSFAVRLSEDTCYRCGKKIELWRDISIDHLEDWLHSGRAAELFWDLDNIKLSHIKCNVAAAAEKKRKPTAEKKVGARRRQAEWNKKRRESDPVGWRAYRARESLKSYYRKIARRGNPTPKQSAKIIELLGADWEDAL